MDDLDGPTDRGFGYDRGDAFESRGGARCVGVDEAPRREVSKGRSVGDVRTRSACAGRGVHATCGVLNNPITKDFCPDTPLFVVRAGKDETPGLNAALDAFTARALAENKPLTPVNYPEAPHSYELSLDAPETRRILQQGLDFLRAKLR